MQVESLLEKELPPQVAAEIQELQHLAFPAEQVFAQQRWWHAPLLPEERWFLCRREGRLIGSVRVIPRTILAAGKPYTIGAIGNVCSHPQFRGVGAAKAVMGAVAGYIAAGNVDFGVLMCGGAHDYYAKL